MHRQYCSVKHEKKVKVRNGQWQWTGYIKVDVCMKLRYCRGLGFKESEVNALTKHCSAKVANK